MSELNAIHPFREGNGRIIRLWAVLVSNANNRELDWKCVSAEEIMAAMINSFKGNSELLVTVLNKCLINM